MTNFKISNQKSSFGAMKTATQRSFTCTFRTHMGAHGDIDEYIV